MLLFWSDWSRNELVPKWNHLWEPSGTDGRQENCLQKISPSYTNTFTCVTTQARLQSLCARGLLPWRKRHSVVYKEVWTIRRVSVDEVARSHSLISNNQRLCSTGLATVKALLMGLDWSFWLTWMYRMIEFNGICAWICTVCFPH